jgi:hypothetical protein
MPFDGRLGDQGEKYENDVPPPDYEDVVREGGHGTGADGGDMKEKEEDTNPFDLRNDEEEEGRGFLAARDGDDDEIVGGGSLGNAGVKMGFFERVRARKEAKRRAWMEKRAARGGAGVGFGCRGGRRGHCM